MYFPRMLAHDKLRGHFEPFAPCGAIAGMLARTDEACPVWGPAKLEEAVLRPGYRPICLVAEDRRMRLALHGVNTLQAVRSVARIGVKPRTLAAGSAGAADWQSLAARRLALFIVNSIEHGTRWVSDRGAACESAGDGRGSDAALLRAAHGGGSLCHASPRGSLFRRLRSGAAAPRAAPQAASFIS